jgi:hypothetical protein
MGWSRGSELFSAVIAAARVAISDDDARRGFYVAILPEFNDLDWDTQNECEGEDPVFDKILRECGYIEEHEGAMKCLRDAGYVDDEVDGRGSE